jgi:hypothetical protein
MCASHRDKPNYIGPHWKIYSTKVETWDATEALNWRATSSWSIYTPNASVSEDPLFAMNNERAIYQHNFEILGTPKGEHESCFRLAFNVSALFHSKYSVQDMHLRVRVCDVPAVSAVLAQRLSVHWLRWYCRDSSFTVWIPLSSSKIRVIFFFQW